MLNPGIISFGDVSVSGTDTITGDWTETDLAGLLAAAAQFRFGGGTTGALKVYLQTSFDQGTTPVDIACVVFATAAETALLNFSALTPKLTQINPTDGTMADDTAIDGLLGDRFRIKLKPTIAYTGTPPTFSGRLCLR